MTTITPIALDEARHAVQRARAQWMRTNSWMQDAPTTDARRAAEPFERTAYNVLVRARFHARKLEEAAQIVALCEKVLAAFKAEAANHNPACTHCAVCCNVVDCPVHDPSDEGVIA